ncbi:RND transporter hydrophobe/amphiphile efflux-1 (HAE1) family [Klebsiella variicola]|uniref:RND transporter hydrophobe/amphiphile efflux-1 (HAE1) family n=1 Tax=Klebsiella variicola TaxID=244366 RepID=A0A7H4MM53_KLEVA|nr:RND transporter hydrophobe/amphiphile efflux-1 (HAE1) family [Klebsiella variicola]
MVPTLLLFNQPFGINALVGLIALSGILMRNTLILIGQIHHNEQAGLDPFHAVVEATVQRARPVLLTALAANPGVHSAHPFGLLGNARLYADWRDAGGNHHDPYFPAGHVRDLVPHPTSAPG